MTVALYKEDSLRYRPARAQQLLDKMTVVLVRAVAVKTARALRDGVRLLERMLGRFEEFYFKPARRSGLSFSRG